MRHIFEALLAYKNGDWETAHNVAQAAEGQADHDRLHAFLHRAEGDSLNALYWYRRSGLKMPNYNLDQELQELLEKYAP
jgi:hypothetical protein